MVVELRLFHSALQGNTVVELRLFHSALHENIGVGL